MEANATTTTAPKKRISKTARWARAHKWVIEVVDPEQQARCKAYKDGQRIIPFYRNQGLELIEY